ncbi:MAG: DUF1214 domain-containing protein [Caulobacteraceae bacterium]|nr:DUF1214 domain-containing protein [Caulobacteraceae bacterium]
MLASTIGLGAAAQPAAQPAAPAAAASSAQGKLPDWSDYLEQLKPIGDRMLALTQHPDDPQQRQETWRTLMGWLAQGFIDHVYDDPDYPEITTPFNLALNLAAPNPDYIYQGAPISGGGVYRIRGFRGTNRFVEVSIAPGSWQLDVVRPNVGDYDLNELHFGPDGAFDVILSAERPKGYAGDWWRLDPSVGKWGRLGIRQASYDWVHERDAVITIERLDVPPTRPRLTAEELSARMSAMAMWVEKGSEIWWKRVEEIRAQGVINRVQPHSWAHMGGAKGQIYDEGMYRLADDEALVLSAPVPKTCRYWSFMIGDDQFDTIDWMNHQSSLNGYQAHVDKDGVFRTVISLKDPGAANWLDTGGNREGIIQVRWNNCDSAPTPTAQVVKLADLRHVLPPDTAFVTPQARDAALRERRYGYQLRRKW